MGTAPIKVLHSFIQLYFYKKTVLHSIHSLLYIQEQHHIAAIDSYIYKKTLLDSNQSIPCYTGTPAHRGNGGDKRNADPGKTASAAARAGQDSKQPISSTPTRPSSALNARQTNSTPRPRSRPTPAVRSLSTPLARSLSVRVCKKERRWSERLRDPKSPVSTTYKVTVTALLESYCLVSTSSSLFCIFD